MRGRIKIKQGSTKSVWEDDERLKRTINEGDFFYDDKKHKEWFISMLLTHLHGPMGQKKIDSKAKALEVSMKLEVAPKEYDQFRTLKIQIKLEAINL